MERRVVRSGDRDAPELLVAYQCPKCKHTMVLDAYDGPPSCLGRFGTGDQHRPTFCIAMEIVKGEA